MNNLMTEEKARRLAQTKGIKGWAAMLALLAAMCVDQFVVNIPFANIVFPVLVICAACMSPVKNLVLVTVYSVLFELSCIAWNPLDLMRAHLWLLEVWIGYMMPLLVYKAFNFGHKNISIFSYAAMAMLSSLLYFWVSVAATVLLWGVNPAMYILSDIPYEIAGSFATFACALPAAFVYKLSSGELTFKRAAKPLAEKIY